MQLSLIIWSPVLLPLFLLISTLRNPTEISNTGQVRKDAKSGPTKFHMNKLKLVRKHPSRNLILLLPRPSSKARPSPQVHQGFPFCPRNGKLWVYMRDVWPGRSTSKGRVGTWGTQVLKCQVMAKAQPNFNTLTQKREDFSLSTKKKKN